MDKKQREARRHQEDMALNRGLLWVGAAIILEFLLLLINRYYINFRVDEASVNLATALHTLLKVVRIGGAAAAVLCLVWAVLRFQKGGKLVLPVVLTAAFGALAICSHVTLAFQGTGVRMLFLLVPAWAGLALVYYLYQKEFFLSAVAVGLSILGLWCVRFGGALTLESGLIFVGILVVSAATLWLKKSGGAVKYGERELQLLSKNASYPVVLVSCLASLLALAAAMALGASVAYYLIFLMIAWLFALLVYYTVKLM